MHPSATLIVWLAGIVAVQYLGVAGLGLMAASLLLSAPAILPSWWRYLRRARWLLLTLWLILAFNTPGEAFQDLAWAPTYEGIAEASLQAARLVLMLGMLAWLFSRLGRDGLVNGLWGLMHPLQRWGLDTGRVVVRLSLVLANLQIEHEKGAWKKMLAGDDGFADGPDRLEIAMPRWMASDTLLVLGAGLALCGAVAL